MRDIELFETALGIVPPWKVARYAFSPGRRRLDIVLVYAADSAFACPICGAACPVHESVVQSWRHLDFFQHQAFLEAAVPSIRCPQHGVHPTPVPWARAAGGTTRIFAR